MCSLANQSRWVNQIDQYAASSAIATTNMTVTARLMGRSNQSVCERGVMNDDDTAREILETLQPTLDSKDLDRMAGLHGSLPRAD